MSRCIPLYSSIVISVPCYSLRLTCIVQVTQDQRRLFEYIEDADLWRWRLPDSKAFHAGSLMCNTCKCLCTLKDALLLHLHMSLASTAVHAGLGSMELEYDANKNPDIFEQLCCLDLKQVIHQVPAEPMISSPYWPVHC